MIAKFLVKFDMCVYIYAIIYFSWVLIVLPERFYCLLGKNLTEKTRNFERRVWERILKHEQIENFNVTQWRAHEPLISIIPVEFIRKINVTDDELITYLGTLELKNRQLCALAEVVNASRGVSVLNKEREVLKLGNIICGYSVNDLSQITAPVLRFLLRNNFFQNLKGCSIEHLRLLAKEVQRHTIIGPTKTWDPEVVELAGHLLAGLDEEELREIQRRSIARIPPAVIETIPSNVLKKMRNEQLLTLTKPSLLAWRRNTKDLRAIYSGTTSPVSLKIFILTLISVSINEGNSRSRNLV